MLSPKGAPEKNITLVQDGYVYVQKQLDAPLVEKRTADKRGV